MHTVLHRVGRNRPQVVKLKLLSCVVAAVFVACRSSVEPAGGGIPVISLVLLGGDSIQMGTITLSARPDSAIPDVAAPADESQLALEIVDAGGNRFPLVAGPEPGQFTAAFTALAGERYELSGSAYGRSVSASTVVPATFDIVAPAADTIRLSDGIPTIATLRVPYRFNVVGADGFALFQLAPDGSLQSSGRLREAEGEMVLSRSPGIRPLILVAYDPGAAACQVALRPAGNITGALGCFGSALKRDRFVDAP